MQWTSGSAAINRDSENSSSSILHKRKLSHSPSSSSSSTMSRFSARDGGHCSNNNHQNSRYQMEREVKTYPRRADVYDSHFSSSNSSPRRNGGGSYAGSSSSYQPLRSSGRSFGNGESDLYSSRENSNYQRSSDRRDREQRERPRGDDRYGGDYRDRERERESYRGYDRDGRAQRYRDGDDYAATRSPRERDRRGSRDRLSGRDRERDRERRRSRDRRDRDDYYRTARYDAYRRSPERRHYRARDRYSRYDTRYDYYGERRYRQRSRTPSPSRRRGRYEHKRKCSPSESSGRSASSSRSRSGSRPRSNSLDDRDGHIKIAPGQTLTPRYAVRQILGEGTFGKVLDCWDSELNKNVALKVVRAVEKYKDAAMIEIDILEKLQKYGCEGKDMCVALLDWFEFRKHIVMSFERFGLSLYDFIKQNHYQGFSIEHVEEMGYQLIKAIAFMHDLTLIHTDLKPENILLVNSEWDEVPLTDEEASRRSRSRSRSSSRSPKEPLRSKRVPRNTAIKVIDFGSATFDSHHHTRVISTRHYRAPEVILGLGWTYPADIWSIGCILVELLTGDALFVTHDNLEHLAMMERVFGPIPESMSLNADRKKAQKFFNGTKLRWPELARERVKHGTRYVDKMHPLEEILAAHPDFLDLVQRLLDYDPDRRITARDALKHRFFDRVRAQYGNMGDKPDSTVIESIVATSSDEESDSEDEDEDERERRHDGSKRKKQKRNDKSGSRSGRRSGDKRKRGKEKKSRS